MTAAAVGESASSFATYNPSFVPASAVDGNAATFWVSVGVKDQWVEVDLGEPTDLVGVKVVWYSPWKVRNYKIQLWDGQAWVDQVVRQDDDARSDSARSHAVVDRWATPVKTQKLRVVCVDVDPGSGNTSIREIMPLRVE